MSLTIQQKIQNAHHLLQDKKLPAIPEEVLLLREELTKKYPNSVNIANLIAKNPENLSLFLKIANTNVVKQDEPINDVKAAVNLIGLGDLFNLYVSSVLSRTLIANPAEAEVMNEGMQVGIVAAELSYWVYDVSRSEAFMLGLLQNIGYLFMLEKFADYETQINRLKVSPLRQFEAEEARYQTDHAVLSSILGKKWGIPEKVVKAVLFHHDAEFHCKLHNHPTIANLVALVMVSSYIVYSSDERYLTQELKDYGKLGSRHLKLPDEAMKAGRAALQKWGKSGTLMTGSH
ncbi:HDOD domain-containing protein [Thiomicrorhabdus sp. 6S2-11]|jgi:HD-like signal output (HDOD) protein|uniref:HDOD domain-containing protein n=1 Tax=Thiomicrorhabdus marina TaxID=2818442 RepID=A0ABS3Q5C0_9GAMM|nr:HDOD domain-containing protein [Thiomicrorhabdus marina]MBO1927040.1 HDOD domain-containing protein [Thiomicrorhabdus marina]